MASLAEEEKPIDEQASTKEYDPNALQDETSRYVARKVSTESMEKALLEFAPKIEKLRPRYKTRRWMLRWLRAREFDQDKALEMALASHEWRNKSGAETILKDHKVPIEIHENFPGGSDLHSVDKDGDINLWEGLGNVDIRGVMGFCSDEEIIKRTIHSNEQDEALLDILTEKLGRDAKMNVIQDLNGLGTTHLWRPAIETFRKIISVSSGNYPERVKRVFIIRAPGLFMMVWTIVKHFFDKRQRAKFFFLGSNYLDTMVQNGIPLEVIPTHLGGKWETDKIIIGGKIPADKWKDYGYKEIVISAGTKHETFTVEVPKGKVFWPRFYEVNYRDCGFTLKKDGKEILNIKDWRSHTENECLEADATFEITFDNSYSWFTSKTVHYRFDTVDYRPRSKEE